MLRNVAGPHVQSWTDDAKRLVTQRAGSLKILHTAMSVNVVYEFRQRNPQSPVCCRYVGSDALIGVDERTDIAIRTFSPLQNVMGADLYLEVPINEAYQAGAELGLHAGAVSRCAQKIFNAGMRPVGFNFSVGNPANYEDLHRILDASYTLIACGGAIGYHNYSVPSKWLDPDLDLRHRKMLAYLPAGTRFWLNEGFIDHGILDGRLAGWRDGDFHLDAESASRLLRRQAQELSKDTAVIGWTPFGAGAYDMWQSFEYANEPVMCQVFSELYEVGAMQVNVGAGLRKMIPYLGQPLESEVYHFAGTPMETSLAVFENGCATWHKSANETVGIRSDGAVFSDRGNNGDGSSVWQVQ